MGTKLSRADSTPAIRTERKKPHLAYPSKYQVYLLNDDYTPMDFVVVVLEMFFAMNLSKAVKIMLEVHHNGRANCGIYPRDIAETKVAQVNEFARLNDHPLLCKMEKV